jgi:hypothetical protein
VSTRNTAAEIRFGAAAAIFEWETGRAYLTFEKENA